MLISSKKMLLAAQKGGYAVGAFNAENMEMVMAIVAAAVEMNAPAIIQTTPSTLKYATPAMFRAMVNAAAADVNVPIAMHLDHGNSIQLAEKAIAAGYTSIMIDGSQEVFENNIAMTKQVVAMASPLNIPVEAELGKVGGKEDDLESTDSCTDPNEAAEFVQRTGVDSLAVAIGTAHGVYKSVPRLDVPRLKEIRKVVNVPLILHGASGLSDDAVRECIAEGICKVNFATELRIAYTAGVRSFLEADSKAFDPKKYGIPGMDKVRELVMAKIKVCGSNGRAADSL